MLVWQTEILWSATYIMSHDVTGSVPNTLHWKASDFNWKTKLQFTFGSRNCMFLVQFRVLHSIIIIENKNTRLILCLPVDEASTLTHYIPFLVVFIHRYILEKRWSSRRFSKILRVVQEQLLWQAWRATMRKTFGESVCQYLSYHHQHHIIISRQHCMHQITSHNLSGASSSIPFDLNLSSL